MSPHEINARRKRAAKLLPAVVQHRTQLTDSVRADTRELAAELFELACEHRLAGSVQRVLAEQAVELPAKVAEALVAERRRAEAHQLLAVRAIRQLDEALPNGFLVVKGPILSSRWYGDAGARSFSDVDVLVRPQDVPDMIEALGSAGFDVATNNWANFHRFEVAELPLHSSQITVDLHWDLIGFGEHRRSLALDSSSMIDRGVATDLGGVSVTTLDPVDTLLHLCVHGGLAGGRRLLNLLDVDVVARSPDIVWDQFWERAEGAAAVTLTTAVLRRSQHLFDTPVPDDLKPASARSRGWHRAAATLESLPRQGGQPPIGFHLTGARDGAKQTLSATAAQAARSARVAAGGTPLTEAGGLLDWYRADLDDTDIATARCGYLSWVRGGGHAFSIHRTRDVDRLDRMFADLGPRSASALAYVWSRRELDDAVKAFVIRRDDGESAGMLSIYSRNPMQVMAWPILLDPGASAVLGRFIDRSGVTSIAGFETDVEPLRPHLSRWRRRVPVKSGSAAPGTIPVLPDRGARLATPQDLKDLTNLAMELGSAGSASRPFAHRWAKRSIRTGAAVVERHDRLVGFATIEASTPLYDVIGTAAVLPEARGQRLSWVLVERLATLARERGRGIIGLSLASNPMSVPSDRAHDAAALVALLRPPRRFKGEPRLWRALERFAG